MKLAQDTWKLRCAQRFDRTNMKRILKLPVLIHRHYRPVHFIKDTAGMLQETLPLRRKADFLTHTVKQFRAEFFLQKPDLDRNGRL